MKKSLIILGNILIILAVLAAVFLDVRSEQQWRMETKREDFENMTAAMESVTANYLLGEQQVCNAWARYINASDLTAEEAIAFLGKSVNRPQVMAHILYEENGELVGLSTEAHKKDPGDYTVSYKNIDILEEEHGMLMSEDSVVKVTRAYTNPVNAIQSIAFCCNVKIRDEETGENKDAVILRIIPISAFEQRWAFPTEDYQDAVISLIDADGDYIIRGKSFKNSNFYEFYQSYNTFTAASVNELRAVVGGDPGSVEMINSQDQECLIGHTRVNYTDNWIIVTMIPMRELKEHESNWTLIGIIVAGLLLLLIFNLHSVMNLNRQLKAAAVAADQANRAKTDFLSTMSHDIRTPMNAIIGLTTIAGKNTEDQVTVKESLRKINLASNHLLTLINDILDISKVESGKLNLSPVTFSIVECAENLVNISQPMVKEKNIDFNFRVSHFEHEYLYADQLRINQIFINILSNAVKYTEPGGTVDVDIREEKGETDKTVKITYVVADTGIGMTPEYMQHMYDPFTRQTDSRVNTIQGTGLGLSITKKMIDLMNGTIDCESEVGKGTTFTVQLEIAVADKTEEEMKLPPVNVLIADDDDVLRQTAADTLRSIGVEADTAAGGMEAVQKIQDRREEGGSDKAGRDQGGGEAC